MGIGCPVDQGPNATSLILLCKPFPASVVVVKEVYVTCIAPCPAQETLSKYSSDIVEFRRFIQCHPFGG